MCGGSKTSTQTSSNSTTALPQFSQAYSDILNQAKGVASTAYNPATNKGVAGFTAPQYQAFDATQANQGVYQPFMQAAGSSLAQGTLTPEAIQRFISPYTQNVVDATQAQFANQNAQQLQDVNANAAKIGALTGDRSQVARAITQNQQNLAQNPIIAGLYNQGYQTAAQTAGQAASLANQNASLASTIGGQAQQYGQNDVNSLWSSGLAQQNQQQNTLDANTANAQQQTAWPYQNLQWLSSLATGLGGAAGSTSSGSQTTPGPNIWSQILGAGLSAASMFKDGGRVGYADGGVVPFGGISWMPQAQMPSGGIAPQHANFSAPSGVASQGGMGGLLDSFNQAKSAFSGVQNAGKGLSNIASYFNTSTDPASGWSTSIKPTGISGWGNYLSSMFADGGVVRGYADGGPIDMDGDLDYGSEFHPQISDDGGFMGVGSGLGPNLPVRVADNAPSNSSFPWMTDVQPEASGIVPQVLPEAPAISAQGDPGAPSPSRGWLGFETSDPIRRGMLAAGLGMMASNSPFIGQAIGQGGLKGVEAYSDTKQSATDNANTKRRIDMEAARLQQAARETSERLRIANAQEARSAEMFPLDQQIKKLQVDEAKRGFKQIGTDDMGKPVYGFVDTVHGTVTPVQQPGQAGTTPEDIVTATGDDYLKSLPQKDAMMVKKMVNGEIQPPSPYQLARSPYWNGLMLKAGQYDPEFDFTSWGARFQGRKDFYGGGKSAEMVRAANQTIDHVGHLVESFEKLENGQYPLVNAAVNYAKQHWAGKSGIPDFLANAHAVADEMAKVFKGANLSDTEIKAWKETLSENMSPEQQKAAVGKLMDLLDGSLNALESKREQSLGPTLAKKYGPLLTPHAQEVLAKVRKWQAGEKPEEKIQGRLSDSKPNGIPAAAIDELRKNPTAQTRQQFDAAFGAGSADRILGG